VKALISSIPFKLMESIRPKQQKCQGRTFKTLIDRKALFLYFFKFAFGLNPVLFNRFTHGILMAVGMQ